PSVRSGAARSTTPSTPDAASLSSTGHSARCTWLSITGGDVKVTDVGATRAGAHAASITSQRTPDLRVIARAGSVLADERVVAAADIGHRVARTIVPRIVRRLRALDHEAVFLIKARAVRWLAGAKVGVDDRRAVVPHERALRDDIGRADE